MRLRHILSALGAGALFAVAAALASGPVNPPFVPTFGTGAPGAGAPKNQLYFDSSSSPLTPYVYEPGIAWEQYGAGSSSCPAGSDGQFQLAEVRSVTACVGSTAITSTDLGATVVIHNLEGNLTFHNTGGNIVAAGGGSLNLTAFNGLELQDNSGTEDLSMTGGVLSLHAPTISIGGTVIFTNQSSLTSQVNQFTSSLSGAVPPPVTVSGNCLKDNGGWGGCGGAPGGSFGQVQFNNAGAFGGLTAAQLTADVNVFAPTLAGLVPSGSGGTVNNLLHGDGTWAPVTGGNAPGIFCTTTNGALQYNNAGVAGCALAFNDNVCQACVAPVRVQAIGSSAIGGTGRGSAAVDEAAFGDSSCGWPSHDNSCLGSFAGGDFGFFSGHNNVAVGSHVAGNGGNDGNDTISLGTSGNCVLGSITQDYFQICAGTGTTPLMEGSLLATALHLTVHGPVRISTGYTVSTLPAGATGDRAYVTDALACTFLAALTGGGSTVCPVFFNGAAWIAG